MPDTNYIVSGSDLTDIADSIRSKTGGSDPLEFPEGFTDAIDGISTLANDTATATATAADIKYGKSAYAKGSRIVGTYQPTATISANVRRNVGYTISPRTVSAGATLCTHNKPSNEAWASGGLSIQISTSNLSGVSVQANATDSAITVTTNNSATIRSSGTITISYVAMYVATVN